MAHELIDSVTVDPAGPVTVTLGGSFDITASYSLNGPNPGNPTVSGYSLLFQRISPGAPISFDVVDNPLPDTDYTKTCPAAILAAVGAYVIRVEGYYFSDALPPNFEQAVDVDITVNVVAAPHYRDIEAEATERTAIAGVESRSVEATLPDRNVVAGAKEI